ncbi:FecR family protein [Flavobacterium sp. XS2P39]|uniref:FecR family protein n=1 Tax=Flavobacterium sp. XS2P39 TaxID=3401725 RepID=UPI003AB039B8
MLNVSRKEKKCVRYIANEMSKAERSVFEIELSLDDELLAIFENYKMIWANYPQSNLPVPTPSFNQVKDKYRKSEPGTNTTLFLFRKQILFAAASLVICLGFYFTKSTSQGYANHKMAKVGERLTLLLPDSSTVILNSGSDVKYFSDFGEKREVWLVGEAFFKVRHNKNSPFIVHTDAYDVKVLGTEFNINNQSNDKTVSLEKGKVNVLLKESNDEINLLPTEELVWNSKTKAVTKRNFDVGKISAWKDNILILDDLKLQDALLKINQFYGVHFSIKDSAIANQRIKGAFKEQQLDEFIAALEFISNVTITKNGKNTFEITHEK